MALTDDQKRSAVGVSNYSIGPGLDPTASLNDNNKQAIGYGIFGLLTVAVDNLKKAVMWFRK